MGKKGKYNGVNHNKGKIEYCSRNQENKINPDIERMNLEFLLLNTLTISAWKVQTVVNQFMEEKPYTRIFCFTEIKVDCLNFNPIGIKVFSKHRKKKREGGGGLMIGYIDDKKTKLEEIK